MYLDLVKSYFEAVRSLGHKFYFSTWYVKYHFWVFVHGCWVGEFVDKSLRFYMSSSLQYVCMWCLFKWYIGSLIRPIFITNKI